MMLDYLVLFLNLKTRSFRSLSELFILVVNISGWDAKITRSIIMDMFFRIFRIFPTFWSRSRSEITVFIKDMVVLMDHGPKIR